jgi:gluconokinase
MKHGIPLTDADRAPWLTNIHSRLHELSADGKNAVLACSALKQSYRETLSAGLDFRIVYLRGTYQQMRKHIATRRGHFAGESILADQFADLEEPTDALTLDVAGTPERLANQAIEALGLRPATEP